MARSLLRGCFIFHHSVSGSAKERGIVGGSIMRPGASTVELNVFLRVSGSPEQGTEQRLVGSKQANEVQVAFTEVIEDRTSKAAPLKVPAILKPF
eukprot:883369-Pelagomonas_calceolata.AAC.1